MIASFFSDDVVIFGGKISKHMTWLFGGKISKDMTCPLTKEEEEEEDPTSPLSFGSSSTCSTCSSFSEETSSFSEETTEEGCLQTPLPHSFPIDAYDSDIGECYPEEAFGCSRGKKKKKVIADSDDSDDEIQDFDNVNDKDCLLAIYGDFPHGVKRFKATKRSLTKQKWKRSWPKEGESAEPGWVNVYGFFDENRGYGGYGVIVRDMSAKPIAASVHFSLKGVNYLYQVFKGLDAGLKLALKNGCSSPHVVLNSEVVVRLLTCIASGIYHIPGCRSVNVNNVCQSCTMALIPCISEYYFKNVETLLETLVGKIRYLNFTWQPRSLNKAAYYLAKQAKRTLLIFGGDKDHYKADIKPEEFPKELLDILWSDAYDSVYYNLEARAMIFENAVPKQP